MAGGAMMKPHKVQAESRPTPVCPKCGLKAIERRTRYGIRASCCDLWSWDRDTLVDEATHVARQHLGVLLRDLNKQLGATLLLQQLRKHEKNIPVTDMPNVRALNEVSCKKVIKACENVMMDIVTGEVKPPPMMAVASRVAMARRV